MAMYSVAPELKEYLRTKFAVGAAPGLSSPAAWAAAPPMYTPKQMPPTWRGNDNGSILDILPRSEEFNDSYNRFLNPLDKRFYEPARDTTEAVLRGASRGGVAGGSAIMLPLAPGTLAGIGGLAGGTALALNSEGLSSNPNEQTSAQPAAPKTTAPTAGISAPAPESTAKLPLSDPYAYGLSGAGAGALLGAIMARKGKRGRNALLGAGIGGGAGLLANYLMNQKKSASYQKVAGPVDMASSAIGGGSAGALLGSLYGAATAPKKKLLRAALRGALMGGGAGASAGLGLSAFGKPSFNHGAPEDIEQAGFVRGLGTATAGGLGASVSQRLADQYLPLEDEEELRKNAWSKHQPGGMYGATKSVGLTGAGLGALSGAAYGAAHPGETKDKKQRSRLLGAIRGLAAGGAIGGGLGVGAGLAADAVYEPTVFIAPGVGLKVDTVDAGIKRLEDGAKRVGDTVAPYADRAREEAKKVNDAVTPWVDWWNGKK